MNCPDCGAEIPEVSRFCLSCGKPVPPPKQLPAQQAADPDPSAHAMMLFGLSFMMFFFTLVPIFLGLWIGALLMAVIGMSLVGAGVFVLRSNKQHIEKVQMAAAVKIKCRYCGMLNAKDAGKCDSCGATL